MRQGERENPMVKEFAASPSSAWRTYDVADVQVTVRAGASFGASFHGASWNAVGQFGTGSVMSVFRKHEDLLANTSV